MTPRDAGFLACRVLSIVLLSWALNDLSSIMLLRDMQSDSNPFQPRGVMLVQSISAGLFATGSGVLWYGAKSISGLLTQSGPSSEQARFSGEAYYRLGLRLVGVYFVFVALLELGKLGRFIDIWEAMGWAQVRLSHKVQLGLLLVLLVVALILAMGVTLRRGLNYPRPLPGELDE